MVTSLIPALVTSLIPALVTSLILPSQDHVPETYLEGTVDL